MKKNFEGGGMTIFPGMGRWTIKMNITFSMRNKVLNRVLKFFPQKSPYRLNESQNPILGIKCNAFDTAIFYPPPSFTIIT